jgi:hypothetical protein
MARSTEYESRVKTVGQYGLQFGRYENNIEGTYREASAILYKGPVERVPDKVWEEIAPVHENFAEYQALAMMPLYKGRGRLSRGTESAKMAVLSVLTPTEDGADYEWVVIWKLRGAGHFQDRENFKTLLRCLAAGDEKIWYSETGKVVAGNRPKKRVEELEEQEGGKYRLVPMQEALCDALYGSKYDMSTKDEADWAQVRQAFNLSR